MPQFLLLSLFTFSILAFPSPAFGQMLGLNKERIIEDDSFCPHEKGWHPTAEQLQQIFSEHKKWYFRMMAKELNDPYGFLNYPAISGRAILCKANMNNAKLEEFNFLHADLNNVYLQKAELIKAKLEAVEMRGARLRGVNLSGANLWAADLRGSNLEDANLSKASTPEANFEDIYGSGINLSEAKAEDSNFTRAKLSGANFNEASLRKAKFVGARLEGAIFTKGDLEEADLSNANLDGADLSGAILVNTQINGANFTEVDLNGVLYEPIGVPAVSGLASLKNLTNVWFREGNLNGLVQLRKLLVEAGLRDLEREATYALEFGKTRYQLSGYHPRNPGEEATILLSDHVRENPFNFINGVFRFVMFEWTTKWGLKPGRAILILLGLMGLMSFVYIFPILRNPNSKKEAGIYKVWPQGRLVFSKKGPESAGKEKMEPLSKKGIKAFGWALYFSLLSATTIGWRELNVGNWISRVQPKEFGLRGRGWVRVASGAQSLISVYLIAIWALTYFGRPFQ